MRDSERIQKTLNELQQIWEQFPEMRLGQLLCNVIDSPFLYYVEDDMLLKKTKEYYDRLKEEEQ